MSDIKVTVGGPIEEDAARGFVDAWHRAERGESFRERHLAFESWVTGKRMELLRHVRRHKVASIRALAKALGRDYSNVHADVQALTPPMRGGIGRLRRDRNPDRDLKKDANGPRFGW